MPTFNKFSLALLVEGSPKRPHTNTRLLLLLRYATRCWLGTVTGPVCCRASPLPSCCRNRNTLPQSTRFLMYHITILLLQERVGRLVLCVSRALPLSALSPVTTHQWSLPDRLFLISVPGLGPTSSVVRSWEGACAFSNAFCGEFKWK